MKTKFESRHLDSYKEMKIFCRPILINPGMILGVGIYVIMASGAMAQQLGFNFTTPGNNDNGASFAVTSFRFQVTSPIMISGLAAYDPAAPSGIGGAVGSGGSDINVGLWDDSGTLLAAVSVPNGTTPIPGTYFCKVAITPVTLQPGFYRIADTGYRTSVNGSVSGFAGYTNAPGLTYISDCYSQSGYGFSFPPYSDSYSFLNVNIVLQTAATMAAQYSVDWFKIAGGGGTSTNSIFSITGAIGQPDASQQMMTNGIYSASGGFWSLISVVQTLGAPTLTITHSGNSMKISWPYPSTGFVLQQNSNLTTSGWSASSGISNDGTNNFITITSPTGNLFFRPLHP